MPEFVVKNPDNYLNEVLAFYRDEMHAQAEAEMQAQMQAEMEAANKAMWVAAGQRGPRSIRLVSGELYTW